MRPDFITQQDIERWDNNLAQDASLPSFIREGIVHPSFRELIYSGAWLSEQLQKLGCHEILVARICYTAGQLSFGQDCWQVAQEMLQAYQNNDLEFEIDYNETN
jgi:hypothetical protein